MEVVLTALGALGLVAAIFANVVAVARFVQERRAKRAAAHAMAPTPAEPDDGHVAHVAARDGPPAPERRRDHAILTPDQRVRVFVSSTLQELAAERVAARRAIESLRLTPVMFELGARPHSPRDLYRAYLAQSDVFVAIYAQRYGWIAPGETVSGLEDEYVLSAGMPRLVYVRAAEGPRDDALVRLLERVRADDAASYKPFRTPEELAGLIVDDLALVLSERFVRQAAGDAAPSPSTVAPLPVALTSFVGRATLLDALEALLRRPGVRLVTLAGPAGSGKSRLAVEAARRLQSAFGEVAYVSLAAVREPALVATSVAIALGVKETAGVSPIEALRRALAGRSGLLVIDNFEQVVEAAPVVADIIQAAPGLTVLVTSRSVLRLSAEVVFPVPPLDLPAAGGGVLTPDEARRAGAVQLFVDRARATDPSFELDDHNTAAVVEICRRVDALPLALELAAARTRALPPSTLLARMTKRLPLLSGGPRDAPARQRTLRDAIDWSVALLDTEEQRLFARLAIFEGGASLTTVEEVLGGVDVLEVLSRLVDESLVQRRGGSDEDRVTMLETVREYAAERLEADPDAASLRSRHARVYLAAAERGAAELRTPARAAWQRFLEQELANLRLALTTFLSGGAHEEALRLAAALRPFFLERAHYAEGRRLVELALEAGRDVTGPARAAAALALGALAWRQGDLAAALGPAEESLAWYRATGDLAGSAAALRLLGVHAQNAGAYDLARARLEEALEAQRDLGDAEGVANALLSLGNVALDRGDPSAREIYEESLATAAAIGDDLGVAYALDNLGVLAWCWGDLDTADARTAEAAVLYERLDHPFGLASVEHRRGLLALARGDVDAARSAFERSLALRERTGESRGSAFVHHDLARVALARGRPDEARGHLRQGLDLAERHGADLIAVLFLEAVAAWRSALGAHLDAAALLAASATWRQRQGVPVCAVNVAREAALRGGIERETRGDDRRGAEARGGAMELAAAVAWARTLLGAG